MAADAGCISILFTNTKPNMPPWGGKDSRLGNNPLVIAIPRKEGHVVLDMAISQYSFGKIHEYKLKNDRLPYYGGWDANDRLSKDPEQILNKERGLPIGYWKGSALSMVLDMLATILSAGNSTFRIGQKSAETAISQVFFCIDPERFQDKDLKEQLLNEIIEYTRGAEPMVPGEKTCYPGEQRKQIRKRNLKKGVSVDATIWQTVLNLLE
jgi:3-dehydro-L-gulonate 2-dehydrogenase